MAEDLEFKVIIMFKNDLPLLNKLIDSNDHIDRNIHLTIVTHVLPTAVPYVAALSRRFDVTVVGIPYSADRRTVAELRLMGYPVHIPKSVDQIAVMVMENIGQLERSRTPNIVQEVGGYLASYSQELGHCSYLLGVVEDTNNGHWRYAKYQDDLCFPVVSIARSPIKALEDIRIGDAVAFSLERILRDNFFTSLGDVKTLVLGFGKIGHACADALARRLAKPSVFDVDPLKLMAAQVSGYQIGAIDELLRQSNVIIGATGKCSIREEHFNHIQDGTILASASSRQIEFDVPHIRMTFAEEMVTETVTRYDLRERFFYLLCNGFPINFRDLSILGTLLDAIYSELFLCIVEIAKKGLQPGLKDSWEELHQEVARSWLETRWKQAPEKMLANTLSLA